MFNKMRTRRVVCETENVFSIELPVTLEKPRVGLTAQVFRSIFTGHMLEVTHK